MACAVIEIEPEGSDWIVQHDQELKARFPDTPLAVAFARRLADQLRGGGRAPRILVRFSIER
jgi:hypothetical protein